MIQTATKFFKQKAKELESDFNDIPNWVIEEAIEFAKLHVAAQQKALEQNMTTNKNGLMYVDADDISTSYPLTNIK